MLVRFLAPAIVAASMLFASSADAGLFHKGCCDVAPSCGCEVSCGCEIAPSCGCEVDPCCGPKFGGRLKGLLSKLHAKKSCCAPACDACAPTCCEPAPAPVCCAPAPAPVCCDAAPTCCEPAPCCVKKHCFRDLLAKLKARRSACCAPACDSCSTGCDSCGAPSCGGCGN